MKSTLATLAVLATLIAGCSGTAGTPSTAGTVAAPTPIIVYVTPAPVPTVATTSEPTPASAPTNLTAGQPVNVGALTYTVNGIAQGTSNNDFISPDDGSVFEFLDLSVTNESADSQHFGDGWTIQDSGGYLHNGEFSSLKDPGFSGELAAGQSTRGYITFQTGVGLKPVAAILETSFFGGSSISFALQADIAVATPAPSPRPAPTPVPKPTAKTLLSFKGSGIKSSKPFHASGDSVDVVYTYNCSNFGFDGNFQVYFYGAGLFGGPDIVVNELGMSGKSRTTEYLDGASGPFHIEVNSECNWSVVIVGTP